MIVIRRFGLVETFGMRVTLKSFKLLAERTILRKEKTRMAKDTSAMLSISKRTSHQAKSSKIKSLMLNGLLK